MKKIGLFFWGMSNEHEVSLLSAKNIIQNINTTKYDVVLFYWTKQGSFYKLDDIWQVESLQEHQKLPFEEVKKYIDIAFPITHGKYWEDGVLQGLFEWQNIPYCGCHMLWARICMDKGMFKELMKLHGIKQTKFEVVDFAFSSEKEIEKKLISIKNKFTLPLYVKPANSGSSVWITKVEDFNQLPQAILEAKKHDSKIVIEEGLLSPKEIEIGIVGNTSLTVSNPWELVLVKDFYNYEDKYKNNEAQIKIPANISDVEQKEIKKLAEKVYKITECCGFARIDFFIANDEIYMNEVNTLPWFTDISMFPMLMKNYWMSYAELIDNIIFLAY